LRPQNYSHYCLHCFGRISKLIVYTILWLFCRGVSQKILKTVSFQILPKRWNKAKTVLWSHSLCHTGTGIRFFWADWPRFGEFRGIHPEITLSVESCAGTQITQRWGHTNANDLVGWVWATYKRKHMFTSQSSDRYVIKNYDRARKLNQHRSLEAVLALGGVNNHCSLHCRLAKFRPWFDAQRRKQRCDWPKNASFRVCPVIIFRVWVFLSQSQRCILRWSSNHGISPNDSVNYSGWLLPLLCWFEPLQ